MSDDSMDKSWRYMAITAFSIVGSVIVALITSDSPSEMPFIWALAISLLHFGYWCWSREYIETSIYQERIRDTTSRLDHILNTMPKEDAFKVMGDDTSSIFDMLSVIKDISREVETEKDKQQIADMAKEQIKKGLSSMCSIASLWTVSKARLFEANIMVVKPSEEAMTIPEAAKAFERGKYFFPDPTTLETVQHSCKKCLYVLPDLAINTNDEITIKPIMLPVHLKSTTHPGVIKGAPEAVETGSVISIKNIDEIMSNLPANYVADQKREIQSYFDSQDNCGSILSVPLTIELSNETKKDELNGDNREKRSVDAVINLYRPEDGLIKSPELFQEFTRPLVLMIANLLYLYTANNNSQYTSDIKNDDGL